MIYFRALPLEMFPPNSGGASGLIDKATAATQRYLALFEARDWKALNDHVAVLAGLAERIRVFAASRAKLVDAATQYTRERDSGLKKSFTDLAESTTDGAQQVKQELLNQLTQQLGDAAAAQAALDQLLAGDHALFRSSRHIESKLTRTHELLANSFINLSTLTHRALFEASRYLAHEMTASKQVSLLDGDETTLAALTDELQELHDTGFASLHDMLANNSPMAEFVDAATSIHIQATNRFELMGSVLGGYLGLVGNTQEAVDRKRQQQIGLHATERCERLFVLLAYTALIRAEAVGSDTGRWYSNERRRITTRGSGSGSGVPQGEDHGVDDLGGVEVGTLVRVEGEVRNIRIIDDPSLPKFSTLLELTDMATGARLPVRAHMFSLINNNVADGSYTRINGFVRRNEPWLQGSVGLDIDRINLGELHREHWYDDVVYRVRDHACFYLDGMNMFFTPGFSEGGA